MRPPAPGAAAQRPSRSALLLGFSGADAARSGWSGLRVLSRAAEGGVEEADQLADAAAAVGRRRVAAEHVDDGG
jgi:hypothetical protein